MNIYVGNLSPEVTEDDLREAFETYGQISSVKVIKDRFTGEPRGFGFIEMPDQQEAKAAMEGLNGSELKGKAITVNEARSRADKRRRGGGGGRRSSGGWQSRY
jgi:RNA recognition motif-containing protein